MKSKYNNSTNIVTALDIDLNLKTVLKQAEENTIIFNRNRINKKIKEIRDDLKSKFPDNIEKQIISKELRDSISKEISEDQESIEFKENQIETLKTSKSNYNILRSTINELNDLNEFSSEVEASEIQKIDNFLEYKELIEFSKSTLNLFHYCIETRKKNIEKYITDFYSKFKSEEKFIEYINRHLIKKQKDIQSQELQVLIDMRIIYNIESDIDDIELYDKFNMRTNIDMSNTLSEIITYQYAQNQKLNNTINNFSVKLTPISKLVTNQIISNKLLGILLKTNNNQSEFEESNNLQNFITNNIVTCMKTMYVNNTNNKHLYCTRTLGELLYEITNDEREYEDKQFRQQIYMTYDGTRPTTDEYYKWNGLQVFDIDLKQWTDVNGIIGNIDSLKQKLFEYLSEFNWFLWICKSASGKGIHIYTKVTVPHHIYTDAKSNEYISKYWFNVNYTNKVSIIYDIIKQINKDNSNNLSFTPNMFIEDLECKFLDNTVSRITSGIRLTYDKKPLVNENFIDLQIGLNLTQTINGFNDPFTINKVFFRDTIINKKFIENIKTLAIQDIQSMKEDKPTEIDLSKFVSLGGDISTITSLPRSSINYQLRYNVCNTLAALFGKDGLPIAHSLLDSKGCKNVGEINSFYSCAISNGKNPTKYGLDILKKHGIIKAVETELKEVVDNNFKSSIKTAIEKSLNNELIKPNIVLKQNEYLSDKNKILLSEKTGLTNSKINVILSPPGSGKTEWIKYLVKVEKKRILLVLPYISVIKNKIEIDSEIMSMFECYYGAKDIKEIEYGINAVTTFDKFAKANYEKLSKIFDFIMIDESHLTFTSSYRIEATANVIKKIKELYFISMNNPFAAKICLLTGTTTGEEYFFGNVSNVIRVSKPYNDKKLEFVICDDILDCTTRMASHIYQLIQENYKILIPTNKGEIYSEKIIGMVEHLLQRPIKYGYYKRSNTDQEICRLVNEENTVKDYEIIFCSNYLSVGVDINDNVKFASVYLGNFSGYEIEQFNARIRKTGIKSIYCIQTEKNDGTINDLLLDEPELILKITEADKENFIDDKAIASAKQEFLAQYDPILKKIVTPGFTYLNGKILFNLEEYELISFENKYNECMQHPVKVARELSKYGYKITVSTQYEGLDIKQQEELKSIGIAAAKEERVKKHQIMIGTFIDLIQKNTYSNKHGLEFNNVIGWISKHRDVIIEVRDLVDSDGNICFVHIEFDVFASPLKCYVRSKEALDDIIKPAKYLISRYSTTKTLEIMNQYVDENGILKVKSFQRSINLLKLIDSSDGNELAEPMTKILEKMYDFVDQFEVSKDVRISYNTYKSTIEEWTNNYIDMLGINIQTLYAFEKISDSITELLSDIATKSMGKKGIRFDYNKLPEQNSSNVINRRSVDVMVQTMFKLTSEAIQEEQKSKIKKKHIIHTQYQNF